MRRVKLSKVLSRKSRKKLKREIAKERIKRLFLMAKLVFSSYPELSKRYCWLIERIRKAVNLRLSKNQKVKYCKKCFFHGLNILFCTFKALFKIS
jgi:ribonuclease P protein subunit RPR2